MELLFLKVPPFYKKVPPNLPKSSTRPFFFSWSDHVEHLCSHAQKPFFSTAHLCKTKKNFKKWNFGGTFLGFGGTLVELFKKKFHQKNVIKSRFFKSWWNFWNFWNLFFKLFSALCLLNKILYMKICAKKKKCCVFKEISKKSSKSSTLDFSSIQM